jgi:DNA-binding winged helix-turn-helix (wHTH) protein
LNGDFRLESWLVRPSLNTVSRNNGSIQLEPKVMSVLVCLAEHAPEPVSKERLLQQVWSDTFVGEGVLTRAISELRRVFEDNAKEPRIIQTIAKRGYRLLAPVLPVSSKVEVVPTAAPSPVPADQCATDRIAVFPLSNPEGSPDAEYLLSGIPGSIIRGLSPLPGLTVVAGRTVPSDENQDGNALAFGRRFSVETALVGRLLQRRTKLRLQVDLVDTKTGEQLWADQYDRDFRELFLVQDDVVNDLSKQLRLNLGDEEARMNRRYTESAEAYQHYLKGRHWFESRTWDGFRKSIEYFRNAIQADPEYALAYADLAAVLYLPGYYGMVQPQQSFPNARSTAEKALELDDKLVEGHEALATLNLFDWRWADAEREYKQCLAINPNHTLSHYHYAMCLSEMGRFTEAITEAKEAQIRDPLSGPMNACLAFTLWAAGQYEKALPQALIGTELNPHSIFARIISGICYEQNGMYRESIGEFQEGIQRNGGSMFLGFQGHAFAAAGEKARAWNNVRKLERLSKERYVASSHLAITLAGLGERDRAIQALQRAYEERDSFLVFARILPQFENLRSDARFQDLLERMNFPE